MDTSNDMRSSPLFVAWQPVDSDLLHDPRLFAWEILRRRADYGAFVAAAEKPPQHPYAGPIEVLSDVLAAPAWGLQFC